VDRRLGQISQRRAPVDEVMQVADSYRARYAGWNVRHFHSWYVRVHRYVDGTLAIFHGPRKLADYNVAGGLSSVPLTQAA
jgi:hypothetical protein